MGEKLKNPALAKTLRRLADEGPEYFTHGDWARHFVALANDLGWKIKLEDLSSNPPRWDEPIRYRHKGYEIAQATPPQRQGGVLRAGARHAAALWTSALLGITPSRRTVSTTWDKRCGVRTSNVGF